MLTKIINWIADHDNKKWFIVLYIGFSLVLSITISLFWLLLAVLVHFVFELIGQSKKKEGNQTILLESLWETKLDFALVIFALWLAVYLDFIFGVAGIGAAARIGAQTASRTGQVAGKATEVTVRFAAWNRVIRAILLSVDDVANAIKAVYQGKKPKKKKTERISENLPKEEIRLKNKSSWGYRWHTIDHVGVGLFIISLLLIVLAPILIDASYEKMKIILFEEFHPFP